MVVNRIAAMREEHRPLQPAELPVPEPGAGEVQVRVSACGACHTELDEIEGRTPPAFLPIVPGHQVVGRVTKAGVAVDRHAIGDRVGIGWIFHSSGDENENLSPDFRGTGRDAHGGYAEYMTVSQDYAFAIPDVFTDIEAAPLLCGGSVGYRALRLAGIRDGQPLGLCGFGASGHIVLQLARYLYPRSEICVFARRQDTQRFARELGAHWSGDIDDTPPSELRAIIDTTPAWKPVLASLRHLAPGGRLIINAIRKESADINLMAQLSYRDHLWMEKEIKTVANVTGCDIANFLDIAARIPIRPAVTTLPLERANEALQRLQAGADRGAIVLTISQ
jgi:propanol-preferring alcohol dehydrogenase